MSVIMDPRFLPEKYEDLIEWLDERPLQESSRKELIDMWRSYRSKKRVRIINTRKK